MEIRKFSEEEEIEYNLQSKVQQDDDESMEKPIVNLEQIDL